MIMGMFVFGKATSSETKVEMCQSTPTMSLCFLARHPKRKHQHLICNSEVTDLKIDTLP